MNKLRYGVIGVKGIGDLHADLIQRSDAAELTALVDIDADVVRQKATERRVCGFTDYRDLLAAGLVDAVSIATPHHLHAPIALDCLHAGLHVFVEKPIATRVSEADAMLEVAAARARKLCVGHQYRTFRSSRVMKQLIDDGSIGDVMRVLWSWGAFRPHRYFELSPWKGGWRTAGGGLSTYHLIHDLDTICWLMGRPVQVSAMLGNQLHDIEGDDILSAAVRFENGAYASIQASLNAPGSHSVRQIAGDKGIIVIQDARSMTYDHGERILIGTYEDALDASAAELPNPLDEPRVSWRAIELDDGGGGPGTGARGWLGRLMSLKAKPPLRPTDDARGPLPSGLAALLDTFATEPRPRPHGLSLLMDSFLNAILHGGEPLVDGESSRQSLELANAMALSAIRRKTVDLPLDREEYDAVFEELSTGQARVPRSRSRAPLR
jgi:UDP-N-acetyl-2-amino-2-deoxyglucuronate dehydrogenase